ncbi:MAG: caspase family protein, partial [Pseudomonadota bacterium]
MYEVRRLIRALIIFLCLFLFGPVLPWGGEIRAQEDSTGTLPAGQSPVDVPVVPPAAEVSDEAESAAPAAANIPKSSRLYSSSHALVVGIDTYTNGWPNLNNAVKDAGLMAEALKERGFEVTLATNLNSVEMKQTFEEFFVIKGEDPQARLFVWYAGHGFTEFGEGFLVPADAPRPEAGARFRLKALSLRRFGEYVRMAYSKHAYTVFDTCFAGTIFASQRGAPPPAISRAAMDPVRQFLTAGDADQEVPDDGRFRELFVAALNGERGADANTDGYLTATEMGIFLSNAVSNYSQNRQT